MENARLNYLYIILEEEKRIIANLPKAKGEFVFELKRRLLEITSQKKAYSKYEILCVSYLLSKTLNTDELKTVLKEYKQEEIKRKKRCLHIAEVTKKPLRYVDNSFNLFIFMLEMVIKNSIKAQNGGNIAFELSLIKLMFDEETPKNKWDL